MHRRRPRAARARPRCLNLLGGMDTRHLRLHSGGRPRDQPGYRRNSSPRYRRVRHRLCIPVLQSGAEPDGPGECGAGQPKSARTPWMPARRSSEVGLRHRHEQLPGPALRRRAAAGGHRPGPGQEPRSCCCATSPPARWTTTPARPCLKLLQDTCRKDGMTVVIITHNSALMPMGDRVIQIRSGKVSRMYQNRASRAHRKDRVVVNRSLRKRAVSGDQGFGHAVFVHFRHGGAGVHVPGGTAVCGAGYAEDLR